MSATKPVSLAIVGAGQRGRAYARLAADAGATIAAVAEPDPAARALIAATHDVPADQVYADWTELAAAGRIADIAVIATQERLHHANTVAFAAQGYHILLEKPLAPTEAEATAIATAVEAAGTVFAVCHVLRYTPYTKALRGIVDSGVLGRIASVEHLEPVGWWHHAHSFVRGNWRREDSSGPMLLTKSCHDIDWLLHIVGEPVTRVSSFGSLSHFRADQRPEGAADRCLDCGVEAGCPYSAKRFYLQRLADGRHDWPLSVVTLEPTEASVLAALREGPYGRCVYSCDNDVVDHQVVAMEFASGATASFTMTAFSPMGHRRTRVFGTHGSVEGDGETLTVTDFRDGSSHVVDPAVLGDPTAGGGHGGGDGGLVNAFLHAVRTGDRSRITSTAAQSMASHRVVWAAERARLAGQVVTL